MDDLISMCVFLVENAHYSGSMHSTSGFPFFLGIVFFLGNAVKYLPPGGDNRLSPMVLASLLNYEAVGNDSDGFFLSMKKHS